MPEIDVPHAWQLPLEGTTLIEASAGTGKTWTLCQLYVRLLIEKELAPREVLVVTFTNAATAELKARIRQTLLETRDAILSGQAGAAGVAAMDFGAQADTVRERVTAALDGLEDASITTIHSFCLRVLEDHAFEAGLPFHTELLDKEAALEAELAARIWRLELADAQGPWFGYLASRKLTPEVWLRRLQGLHALRSARLLLPAPADGAPGAAAACAADCAADASADGQPDPALEAQEAALVQARRLLKALCDADLQAVHDALKATPRAAARSVAAWLRTLRAWLDSPVIAWALPKAGQTTVLQRLVESRASGPAAEQLRARAADLLEQHRALQARYERRFALLLVRAAARLHDERGQRNRAYGQLGYDDLIAFVRQALDAPGGERLAEQLRRSLRAALIDEFQDTDTDQFAIFHRLFDAAGLPLVLVGDPKQAIYGFRGADIYAYLEASRSAPRRARLTVNRRSSPALVQAVNLIFSRHPNAFLNAQIGFVPASGHPDNALCGADGKPLPPIEWWTLDDGAPLTGGKADAVVCSRIAATVADLLARSEGGHLSLQIDGARKPLRAADIAILTATHAEAAAVRAALARSGIASAVQTNQSVLQSAEVAELAAVMRAVAHPANPRLVRAALATRLMGESAEGIAALEQDLGRWDALVAEFEDYHGRAQRGGWRSAWHRLLERRRVAARYLASAAGPRRLTNLRHLTDLVEDERVRTGAALERIAERLLQGGLEPARAERELRLESDQALVRVMTMHNAKGLQFPVVFCPFLWHAPPAVSERVVLFHDEAGRLSADLRSPPAPHSCAAHKVEVLAEQVRLAYVALTRAQARCYIAWGVVRGWTDSALAWLVHADPALADPAAALEALVSRADGADGAALRADLEGLLERSGGSMARVDGGGPAPASGPAGDEAQALALAQAEPPRAASLGRRLKARSVASYTSVVALADAEDPDHDAYAPQSAELPPPGESEFPPGARAGSCLHALFERLDPQQVCAVADPDTVPVLADALERSLREHGIGLKHAAEAYRLVRNTLLSPLGQGLPALGRIDPRRRLVEMAFQARLPHSRALAGLLAQHRGTAGPAEGGGWLDSLILPAGELRGFIDLVFEFEGRFYIADYKSNRLPDYGPAGLARVMVEACYDLQYLFYLAALDQHLRRRVPGYHYERHVGGVFYLFLRGMQPEGGGQGIYFARPQASVVQALLEAAPGAAAVQGSAHG
jgi:exodeoxyribonuclease V beta subunit